jgi:SNF2 family DNA or RNA helicase
MLRLTAHNIAEDKEHCHVCFDLAHTARQKSIAAKDGPPDSAKIRKIIELLNEISSRKDDDGELLNEKTILFSQFTSMLDLVEIFLKREKVSYVRC